MKPHVQYLHEAELSWSACAGGSRRKVLNQDVESGAQIALVQVPASWSSVLGDGSVLEVYIVAGSVHFGDGVLGGPGSYHRLPVEIGASVTHSPDGALLVVQTGDPVRISEGPVHIAPADFAWAGHGEGPNRSEMAVLHQDRDTGAQTYALRLSAGWVGRAGQHFHSVSEEVFVVSGDVALEESPTYTDGTYIFRPPHVVHGQRERSVGGCLALTWTSGPLDFTYVAVEGPLDVADQPTSSCPRALQAHLSEVDPRVV